jgi:hypothetical protein
VRVVSCLLGMSASDATWPRLPARELAASLYGHAFNFTCQNVSRRTRSSRWRRTDGDYPLCQCGSNVKRSRECNIVSVGIGEDWHFEHWQSSLGCNIHAFDPTIRLRARHESFANNSRKRGKQIHFHFAGLGGGNASLCKIYNVKELVPCSEFAKARERQKAESQRGRRLSVGTYFRHYGTIDGERLFPLDGLLQMARLGRQHRVDVLKIDCEGCEWDAFAELQRSSPQLLARVDQLIVELHLRTQFQLHGMDQLERLLRHLFVDHGFRIFRAKPEPGVPTALSHTNAPPGLADAGFETNKFVATELSLMRPCGVRARDGTTRL